MTIIRIISSINDNAELIISDSNSSKVTPVDNKRVIPNKLLYNFYNEWKTFYYQSQQLKNQNPQDANIDEEIVANLQKKGRVLASILLGDEYSHKLFDRSMLIFSVDEKYANLPFEILRIHNKFICEIVPVLRQIRYAPLQFSQSKDKNDSGLLLINPNEAQDVYELTNIEKLSLQKIFKRFSKIKKWKILFGKNINEITLLEELYSARLIHFAGHTDINSIPLSNNSKLIAEDISNINLNHIKVVFFNSCYSSIQNTDQNSIAQSFIKAGVKNFIGYNLQIANHVAPVIAEIFWENYFKNKPIEIIIQNIRSAIRKKYGDGELSWIILNHFGSTKINEKNKKSNKITLVVISIFILLILASILIIQNYSQSPNTIFIEKTIIKKENVVRQIKNNNKPKITFKYENNFKIDLQNNEKDYNVVDKELIILINKFRSAPHPFYSEKQKNAIIKKLLESPMEDKMKIIKLKSEFKN